MFDAAFFYAKPPFRSTGLSNNTRQCAAVLNEEGYRAIAMCLTDLPRSDGSQGPHIWGPWMAEHAPRMVVVSALCTPPEDLEALARKFRDTIWVQRIHSNLAWLFQSGDFYKTMQVLEMSRRLPNVKLAFVSPYESARLHGAGLHNVVCMPNVTVAPVADTPRRGPARNRRVELSAIFAVRLLKHPSGHVLASALVNARRRACLHMQFTRTDHRHYNERCKMFANACQLPLVEEPYRDHADFCAWLGSSIHVGLQLSMTESFNYVAVEHMSEGIPVVASEAIPFVPWRVRYEDSQAAADTVLDILADYRGASQCALDAARTIRDRNRSLYLETCQALLN